jgi:hypothetical protein
VSDNDTSVFQYVRELTPRQVWLFLGGVITVLSACVSGGYWFGKSDGLAQVDECIAEVRECESRWEQLEPHVRMKKRIVINEHIIYPYVMRPPKHSESINDEFFADKDIPGLTYFELSQEEFLKTFSDGEIAPCLAPLFRLANMHVWRGESLYKVYSLHGDEEIGKQYPYISVIRVPISRLRANLFEFFKCAFSSGEGGENLGGDGERSDLSIYGPGFNVRFAADILEQLSNKTETLDSMDIVGLYWAWDQITYAWSFLFTDHIDWSSTEIEKSANIVSGTNVFVYRAVKVSAKGSKPLRGDVYVRVQKILVQLNAHLYVIEIASPTVGMAPDIEFEGKTSKWLTSLRIINN